MKKTSFNTKACRIVGEFRRAKEDTIKARKQPKAVHAERRESARLIREELAEVFFV